jgi:hypothetical protein
MLLASRIFFLKGLRRLAVKDVIREEPRHGALVSEGVEMAVTVGDLRNL